MFIKENNLEKAVISIKWDWNGNYVVRFIVDDYIVERLQFSKERAIVVVKSWLNQYPEMELHKYSLLRDEILNGE